VVVCGRPGDRRSRAGDGRAQSRSIVDRRLVRLVSGDRSIVDRRLVRLVSGDRAIVDRGLAAGRCVPGERSSRAGAMVLIVVAGTGFYTWLAC